jgi:uncharacterized protein (TIGR02391 family)
VFRVSPAPKASRLKALFAKKGPAIKIRPHFPTIDHLNEAPVFDVAGVMLELLAAQPPGEWQSPKHLIPFWSREYTGQSRYAIRALSEAWAWLENNGFIATEYMLTSTGAFVTRAGRRIQKRSDFLNYAKDSLLPRELLRADLGAIVRPLFLSGHFDQAVAAAFLQLEIFVREAGGFPDDLVGVQLMRTAFHSETGPLRFPEAEKGEREGMAHLFAGAIATFKNPFSHRAVKISRAVQAASLILFANELLASAHVAAGSKELWERKNEATDDAPQGEV